MPGHARYCLCWDAQVPPSSHGWPGRVARVALLARTCLDSSRAQLIDARCLLCRDALFLVSSHGWPGHTARTARLAHTVHFVLDNILLASVMLPLPQSSYPIDR